MFSTFKKIMMTCYIFIFVVSCFIVAGFAVSVIGFDLDITAAEDIHTSNDTTVSASSLSFYRSYAEDNTLYNEIMNYNDSSDEPITDYVPIEDEVIPTTEEPEYTEYVVQDGDSFWSIASKVYNNGTKYLYVAQSNGLTANSVIHTGTVLKIYNSDYIDEVVTVEEEPVYSNVLDSIDAFNPAYLSTTPYECKLYPRVINDSLPISSAYTGYDSEMKNYIYEVDTSSFEYLGSYFVTGYNPNCEHCCGKTDGITASGSVATYGYSVGISSNIPLGTKLYIEGYGFYECQDRGIGAEGKNLIDIACVTDASAAYVTAHDINVWIVE